MNKQRANIKSSIKRLLAPLCGFAVCGFSVTASAVPPPPPPSAPLGAAPSPPPPAATTPSALPPAPLAPPPPPPAPERPMPSPVMAPGQNPSNGPSNNPIPPSQFPQLSWKPSDAAIPPMWPARFEYEDGDIVLPGYSVKTHPQRGLLVGGLTTFLVPYSISFLIGGLYTLNGNSSSQSEYGPLLIPVFGPFVTLASWDSYQEDGAFIMLANGFTQAAGAAMVISAIVMPDKYLERMAKIPGKPEVFVGARTTTVRLHF